MSPRVRLPPRLPTFVFERRSASAIAGGDPSAEAAVGETREGVAAESIVALSLDDCTAGLFVGPRGSRLGTDCGRLGPHREGFDRTIGAATKDCQHGNRS